MRKQLLPASLTCVLALLLLSACQKYADIQPIDEVAYEPSIAIPLISSDISVRELLEEEEDLNYLRIADNGDLEFIYENDDLTQSAENYFRTIAQLPIYLPDTVGSIPVNFFDKIKANQADIKNGDISFELTSNLNEPLDVTVSVPSFVKDGQAFSMTTTIPAATSQPATVSLAPSSLVGYVLKPTEDQLTIRYDARTASGGRVKIEPLRGEISNLDFSQISGFAERATLMTVEDAFEIEIYDNWKGGSLTLDDPQFKFVLDNSFGFPVMGVIREMTAVSEDGSTVIFKGDSSPASFPVAYPRYLEGSVSRNTVFVFSKENSNIDELINSNPVRIEYKFDVIINPTNDQNYIGFIDETSEVTVDTEIFVPVKGSAKGFEMEYDFDLDIEDSEELISAEFKLIINNGIPVDLDAQLYFLDAQDQIVDSLFTTGFTLMQAATVDANGVVEERSNNTSIHPFDEQRIDKIRSYKKGRFISRLSTADNGTRSVVINADDGMEIKLGLKAELDIE